MRWLDLYIDHLHLSDLANGVSMRFAVGPFSRIGSVFNVVVCASILALTVWMGVGGQGAAAVGAVFAGILEVVFARVCFRAFRGDFDPQPVEDDDAEGADAEAVD